ncbi:MAG: VOC family protein, partial [Gammaproteobacteria bacterium]
MADTHGGQSRLFVADVKAAVVRYHVQDVERAVAFYTQQLGFQVAQRSGPVFAT